MHPITGTWSANIEKSRRHANHQFKNAGMRFDVSGDVVALTQSGVNMSGKQESSTMTMQVDGVEHPIAQAPGVVSVCRWVGTHALEMEGKKDGATVGRAVYAVSDDGGTMTATVSGIDAQGAAFDQVIVFDRDPDQR